MGGSFALRCLVRQKLVECRCSIGQVGKAGGKRQQGEVGRVPNRLSCSAAVLLDDGLTRCSPGVREGAANEVLLAQEVNDELAQRNSPEVLDDVGEGDDRWQSPLSLRELADILGGAAHDEVEQQSYRRRDVLGAAPGADGIASQRTPQLVTGRGQVRV